MTRINARAHVLEHLPGTARGIAKRIGLSDTCVRRWCEALHSDKTAHIGGWHRDGSVARWMPVYHPGNGPDVVKPAAKTAGPKESRARPVAGPARPANPRVHKIPRPHPLMALYGLA